MLKIAWIKVENMYENCITDEKPNITFCLESDREGEALEKAIITCGDWSIETNDQLNNLYEGTLNPFSEYEVKINAVGKSGEAAEAVTHFRTGRLHTPWKAKWITDPEYDFPDKVSPVPMTFRYRFRCEKALRRAWINSTALGVYELILNGKKVGTDYFAPGFTSYGHQIQYQTYEIQKQIQKANTLIAVVAGGWASGSFNYIRKNKISSDKQAFLCELHLEYTDGTTEILATDADWEVTEEGNWRMAEWYDGETYDATVALEQVKWKKTGITQPRKSPQIIAQYGLPVRIKEVKAPISCMKSPQGELIYDFGQNFAGVISAKIEGAHGQEVIFRHAEVLVKDELFVQSLRTAKATATYICTEGKQTYSPKLTYMGFRYVGVKGIPKEKLTLNAYVLHSDFEEIGSFTCSNEMINQLQSNIRWGGKSNFVDIPTDCPQRDERQGWTGDISVFAQTACYNFDMSRFFDKWLLDMRAEQGRGGGIPMVVPRAGDSWPILANSCWGDSCILVPWAEYMARGNKGLLKKQYPSIKKFLKAAKWWSSFLSITPNKRHVWRFPFHFGDWCAPTGLAREWMAKGKWIGTAYFANSCKIAGQIAEILGESEDAEYYKELREKIVCAYRNVFTDGRGKLKKEFQTGYVLPLYFNMTEGQETKTMAKNLVQMVRQAGNKLGTGFPGTPYLLFALSDYGYADVAFDVLLQEKCPSWLYMVKAGGTTIWERWDALLADGTVNIGDLSGKKADENSGGGMVSFNHYASGAVGDWLYRRIAGIEPMSGGYETFRVAPIIGGGITSARGSVKTPYGTIESDWSVAGDKFTIKTTVPVSGKCELILPNGEKHTLSSGKHVHICDWKGQ